MTDMDVRPVVIKVGTSSITRDDWRFNQPFIHRLTDEIAAVHKQGVPVVLVASGAVGAGIYQLKEKIQREMPAGKRPTDPVLLGVLAGVGQIRLVSTLSESFHSRHGIVALQHLVSPKDFWDKEHYEYQQSEFSKCAELGIVPLVNEADTLTFEENAPFNGNNRFGDNDRLAALVAHMLGARVLINLTDTSGLFDRNPFENSNAKQIRVIRAGDDLPIDFSSTGSGKGSGTGARSKLTAGLMAAAGGTHTLIANADHPGVIDAALSEMADLENGIVNREGVGTWFPRAANPLEPEKLWLAFASRVAGRIEILASSRKKIVKDLSGVQVSDVKGIRGEFAEHDVIELVANGVVIGRGHSEFSSADLAVEVATAKRLGINTKRIAAVMRSQMALSAPDYIAARSQAIEIR